MRVACSRVDERQYQRRCAVLVNRRWGREYQVAGIHVVDTDLRDALDQSAVVVGQADLHLVLVRRREARVVVQILVRRPEQSRTDRQMKRLNLPVAPVDLDGMSIERAGVGEKRGRARRPRSRQLRRRGSSSSGWAPHCEL